jgi:hypothetical protein
MPAPVVAEFPWAVVVSGVVGIAGIAGTLLSAHLANSAAEKRRLAEQQNEDRTRFHKERVEIYAKFIAAFKAYHNSMYPSGESLLQAPESRQYRAQPPKSVLAEARESLRLVATDEVASAAKALVKAAVGMENLLVQDPAFEAAEKAALKALQVFRETARAELLPNSGGAATNKKDAVPSLQAGPD